MATGYKLQTSDFDTLRYYQRALTRFFETNELKREGRCLDQEALGAFCKRETAYTKEHLRPGFDGPEAELIRRARTYAWLRDSLLWTIEELLATEKASPERPYVFALRGLLQVSEYAGTVGHDSTTADCYTTLKNLLERACEFASRGE